MSERTFALEARAACDLDARNTRSCGQRRRVDGRRRSEQRNERRAHGRRRVHQSRIVADDDRGDRHQIDRRAEIGAPGHVDHRRRSRSQRLDERRRHRRIVGRAQDPYRMAVVCEPLRQRRKMLRRPALGRAELGAGTQDRDRPFARKSERVECGVEIRAVGNEHRRLRFADGRPARRRERCIPGDKLGHRVAVELSRLRQQAVPRFAAVSDPLRYAREPWNECRFPRVRQHVGMRVALRAQREAERAAFAQRELPVRCRSVEDPADAPHPLVDRATPRWRDDVDRMLDAGRAKGCDEGFRQDGVTHPRWRHDEHTIAGTVRAHARSDGGRRNAIQWPAFASPSRRYRVPQ